MSILNKLKAANAGGSLADALPNEEPSFLSKLTNPVFELLGVSQNILKSGILAAQETYAGDYDAAKEALMTGIKTALPFVPARHIEASEITGSDSFWKNLAFDLTVDPLNALGGIGSLTKVGKLGKRLETLKSLELATTKLGKAEDLAKIQGEIVRVTDELTTAAKEGTKTRSIVKLGIPFTEKADIHIGNAKTISDSAKKLGLFDDGQRKILERELKSVGKNIREEVKLLDDVDIPTEKLLKLGAKEAEIRKLLSETPKPNIATNITTRVHKLIKETKARFGHNADDATIEALHDVTRSNVSEVTRLVGEDTGALISELKALSKLRNVSDAEQIHRLTNITELRHLRTGMLPDYEAKVVAEATVLKDKQLKLERMLEKSKKLTEVQKLERLAKSRDRFDRGIKKIKLTAEENRLRDTKFIEDIPNVLPNEWLVSEKIAKWYDPMLGVEEAVGASPHRINPQKQMVSYTRRLLSDKANALKKSNPSRYKIIQSEFEARLPSGIKRTLHPEKTIDEVNKIVREDFDINFDFFDPNVVKQLTERRLQHHKFVEEARGVHAFLEIFGTKDIIQGPSVSVSKLVGIIGGKTKDKAGKTIYKGLDPRTPAFEKYRGMRIPKAKAQDFLRTNEVLRNSVLMNSPNIGKIMGMVDKLNQYYKAYLTVPFPSFHARNAVSNAVLSKMGGVSFTKQTGLFPKVLKLQNAARTKTLTEVDKKLWDEMLDLGIINRGQFFEVMKSAEQVGAKQKGVMNALRRGGQAVEDNARIIHYLAKKEAGLTPIEAMRSVNKYLFDYSKLTDFERKFARPAFLFYTWMRNNIPLMVHTTLTDPRTVNIYENLTGLNQDEVPSYLKGSRAFPIPGSEGAGTEAIGSLGVPFEDLNMLNIADADPDFFSQISRLAGKILNKASPAFKIPIELIQGEALFTGRKLSSMTTSELIANFTPAGRLVREGTKAINPEESMGMRALDFATGLRTYKIDPKKVQIDKIKRAALASGKFERSGFLVLPKKKYKDDRFTKDQFNMIQREIRRLNKKEE